MKTERCAEGNIIKAKPCKKCKAESPPLGAYAAAQIGAGHTLVWKCDKCGEKNSVKPKDVK